LKKKDHQVDFSSDEALIARSPIYHVLKIATPIFLLHRKGNPVVNETEVVDFYQAMLGAGKECYLALKDKTLDDDEMKLSYKEILSETELWLDSLMQKE
jgi:hypothetical protein